MPKKKSYLSFLSANLNLAFFSVRNVANKPHSTKSICDMITNRNHRYVHLIRIQFLQIPQTVFYSYRYYLNYNGY